MTQHSRSGSFLLLTGNEAPQDALLSIESIEVRPFVPKGILSVRQTDIYRLVPFLSKFFFNAISVGRIHPIKGIS